MRRPQPLPTPPRREPEAVVSDEITASAPVRVGRGRASAPDRGAAADDTPTDVDLPTLDSWADPSPVVSEADPDAVTAVIEDEGVFVRDGAVLAPVVPLAPVGDDTDAEAPARAVRLPRKAGKKASATAEEGASPASEAEAGTGWSDVWRASRAQRRALRKEVRRFTVRSRRRRLIWIVSTSAVLAAVAGSFAVAYSPLFAVNEITVVGTTMLDPAAVAASLDGEIGSPLAAVDRDAVRAQLATFPAVETYSLEARPPHELVVRVVERTPVGVIAADGAYDLVDGAGVVLSTSPTPPAGQPVLAAEGGTEGKAFEALGTVIRSLPESVRVQLAAGSATTAHDVTLTLAETGTTIVWGSAEKSAEKALVLEKIMVARPPAQVTVYDVSSPANVIIR